MRYQIKSDGIQPFIIQKVSSQLTQYDLFGLRRHGQSPIQDLTMARFKVLNVRDGCAKRVVLSVAQPKDPSSAASPDSSP